MGKLATLQHAPMKAYITKYALTRGIERGNISQTHPVWPNMFGTLDLLKECDYHADPLKAISRANAMRSRKIASLRRQIARLEAIDFEKQVK